MVSWRVRDGRITYQNGQVFEGQFVNEVLIKGEIRFPNGLV